MSYILKNTSGLINTRLTDTARQKISQGTFNISYFQIGDSEVSYNSLPSTYNQFNTFILEPNFNSQNSTAAPNSNKQNIKYPYYVDGTTGNTYGIPFMDSVVSPVYNRAAMRGFFDANLTATTINWSAITDSEHVINSNYSVDMSTMNGSTTITLIYSPCNSDIVRLPAIGDIITIFYDGKADTNCACPNIPTPTPTPTPSVTSSIGTTPTPTPTPTGTYSDPCASPTPTPSPTKTYCPTPTPSKACPPEPVAPCVMSMSSCYSMLTYKIVNICGNQFTLDRPTPDFTSFNISCEARVIIYPPNMTSLYDSITPMQHWNQNVINFESICGIDQFDVKVWNMNIPWSESPAGLFESTYKGYADFGSIGYLGTKEYLGYMSNSGQTFFINNTFSAETTDTYYYNSFGEVIEVEPKDQKAIAIIHYTNQTIDYFYGEKFALEPYENVNDTTGQARNFKLHIPWLMWHKNNECCLGETFWVDPPGFDNPNLNLFSVRYMESNKNEDMNVPGLRYYHLWDTHPNSDGFPSRVGKVFPDQKIIVIDDDEIIAAMSYKSNRNWTLPAPKTTLVTPNTCGDDNQSINGVLTGDTEYMYVTYRFTNTNSFTNSLHCNYYTKIQGPNIGCGPTTSQNVSLRFGSEFSCLNYTYPSPTTTTTTNYTTTTTTNHTTTTTTLCPQTCDIFKGFVAEKFEVICQKVIGDVRPDPDEWRIIDFTSQLTGTSVNGYITQAGLTGSTFVITNELYNSASFYDLNDYIPLTPQGDTNPQLNFGDEYYFYGSLETDIQATIYEMRYKINLGQAEFQASSNPTWDPNTKPYISEIGLYDSDNNLMIISKLQSPVLRQGIQQFLVKFDF